MKIIPIPDLHGSAEWKRLDFTQDALFAFLGDYVDSLVIGRQDIVRNLQEVIALKLQYPDKVALLIGNHDIQYRYLDEWMLRCSGFDERSMLILNNIFTENWHLFEYAVQHENAIFTHAGITTYWYDDFKKRSNEIWRHIDINELNIAEQLNAVKNTRFERILWNVCPTRIPGGGRGSIGKHHDGGPLWCDKSVLIHSPLPGYNQVVGHTGVDDIEIYETAASDKIYFTDALWGGKRVGYNDWLTLNFKE